MGGEAVTRTIPTPEAMRAFGRKLAAALRPGDVLLVYGDLGAGKTTFVQGLAAGLGVTEPVRSPTFTLIQSYRGVLPLHHMDLYRLPPGEDLGFDEYLSGDGVVVVEWPEAGEAFWPPEALRLRIEGAGDGPRRVHLQAPADRLPAIREAIDDADAGL
ncbi:tRNA (adenosine(37)-N6)-threonylcarbamoyltransferase complex ATPase subunit type 1 TsaE [Hydrogenibacillus schlegelii]|uniref:tRNA threonylcarbamoyladenosine biosynthesis protein TsaE n=2 Tax=Hydrogenibacillus schlegelii TaxID=1484 RepID=A0A2T5GC52_HYDSH|nr:tRNA (adenosine(37)-N6)-threonylcarbamoyltransferase complex ATPase subunit type 1 TsaE [Hydrogenibacillus schlegelii]PTQ53783.1 MAG: TsaE protein, required for threonylcarbamoyladenosine t(6)A37 formation in tRNA [Hydrogenibacillus schlegelii]